MRAVANIVWQTECAKTSVVFHAASNNPTPRMWTTLRDCDTSEMREKRTIRKRTSNVYVYLATKG